MGLTDDTQQKKGFINWKPEIIQTKAQKEKTQRSTKRAGETCGTWEERPNIHVSGVSKRRGSENTGIEPFEEMTTQNFLKLMKNIKPES